MNFRELTLHYVEKIPEGKVATYGQIASLAGSPRAARVVGGILRGLTLREEEVPWWRVINSKGYISINHSEGGIEKEVQKGNLIAEGIEVNERYEVDLEKYLWVPQKVV